MSRRSLGDYQLPLFGSSTRDARSVFLDSHLQSKEDCGFILIENGDDVPAVDDGDPPVENVGHIAGLAIDCPDVYRGRADAS